MKIQGRVFRMLLRAREVYAQRREQDAGLNMTEFMEVDTEAWRAGTVKATLSRRQVYGALRGLLDKGTIEQLAGGRYRVKQ